jgi:microcystin synthetase protein McyD
MTDTSLQEKQRTVLLLKQMQAKLDAAERKGREPIAVIGIGCRMPGPADGSEVGPEGADAFWDMLESGTDAVGEVPPERWNAAAYYDPDPDALGKMNTKWGGFLKGVDRFDAEFFGISPREATSMDPQQRLVLETAWRALEDAGIAASSLSGTQTGVFLGICTSDYARLGDPEGGFGALDTYSGTGGACGVAAGRLSYTLGLQGPSLVVDTACSSSLVATHLAVQSLRNGECGLALAGGVNLVLLPDGTVTLSRLHMMAPDGRCKPFDAAANGFVRGEGCGVVVLKRLSEAQAAGDTVLAVISGSAVNQDGRSSGLTAPSGLAQERVVREALANAGRKPGDLGYIEAHGTGTSLGDPIEMNALAAVMGARKTPLVVGSVKSNIGHLEAAAGVAGLIKAIGVIRRRKVPPVLNYSTRNPNILTGACPIEVPVEVTDVPEGGLVAGVSSFGFSGTNAHVIVETPPDATERADLPPEVSSEVGQRPFEILPLSARSQEALTTYVADTASAPGLDRFADACFTASTARGSFPFRTAVVAGGSEEARTQLRSAKSADAGRPRVAFLFSGQGAQISGMGKSLYEVEPVFKKAIEASAAILDPLLGRSLTAVMFDGGADLDQTEFAQPALVAFEISMAALLAEWGVEPEAMIGHSLGEYAAAYVSGAASLEEILRLVALRGQLMQALPKGGAMAAVMAGAEKIADVLAAHPDVSLAAENGPSATTVSGVASSVQAVCEALDAQGIAFRPLNVSHAFHSPLIEPMLGAFQDAAARIDWQPPRIPVIGNVDGCEVARFDADYWVRHARAPVAFKAGMKRLAALGCDSFVEIGPQTVLSALGRASVQDAVWFGTGHRDDLSTRPVMEAVAGLYQVGVPVDWTAMHRDRGRRRVRLPGHPFLRKSFWRAKTGAGTAPDTGQMPTEHPHLGAPIDLPDGGALFRFTLPAQGYLAEHRVQGRVIAPAALLLELAVSATDAALINVELGAPMMLDADREVSISSGEGDVRIQSRAAVGGDWVRHLSAITEAPGLPSSLDIASQGMEQVQPADLHAWMARGGVDLGDRFRRVVSADRDANSARVVIAPDPSRGYRLHPTTLDAVLQAVAVITFGRGDGVMRVPVGAERVLISSKPVSGNLVVEARLRGDGALLEADLRAVGPSGETVVALDGLRFAAGETGETGEAPWRRWLLAKSWRDVPVPQTSKEIADSVSPTVATRALDAGLDDLTGLGDALDRVAGGFAAAALAAVPETRVIDRHRQLYARLKILAGGDDGAEPFAALDALAKAYPGSVTELDLLRRCGGSLALVLTGQQDPLELIFPSDAGEDAGNVYKDSPVSAVLNTLVEDAVLAALPKSGPIRILEVGGGTGGTTDGLLARMVADPDISRRIEAYLFTDIAAGLLAKAGQRYAHLPWFQTKLLDLDRDPANQGISAGHYHLVLGANVVHAARTLTESLSGLRRTLVPGGALVLLEGLGGQGWIDLVFGLTEGWWRFTDHDVRPDYPLPSLDGWYEVLARAGFDSADVKTGEVDALMRQSVLVGRAQPADAAWLVVGGDDPVTSALVERLGARHVAPDDVLSNDTLPNDAGLGDGWTRCIYTGALEAGHPAADVVTQMAAQHRLLEPLRTLAVAMVGSGKDLTVITRGATSEVPEQATLWGLGRAIATEHPDLKTRLVDVAPDLVAEASVNALVRELLSGDGEDQVRLAASGRQVARLERITPDAPTGVILDPDASYLITGGFGGLGLATAELLVERGARSLALMGRSQASGEAEAVLAGLEGRGVRITRILGDVSAEADVRAALAQVVGRLAGVFHAAGALDDGPLVELDWPHMRYVLDAKMAGAWLLDRLAGDVDMFVLYSSAVGLIGTSGQANHVAANAYLDALAAHRRTQGKPAVSLAWGAWSEVGSATSKTLEKRLHAGGMDVIPPAQGTAVLDWAIGGGDAVPACTGVLPVRWTDFGRALSGKIPRVLADLVSLSPKAIEQVSEVSPTGVQKSSGTVLDVILREAATVLAAEGASALDPKRNLFDLGLDSLMAVELRNRLQKVLDRTLPSTLLFDHPSPAALARFLGFDEAPVAPETRTAAKAEMDRQDGDAIAIIGMDCRFPGGADSPEAFWDRLMDGFDAVGALPEARLHDAGFCDAGGAQAQTGFGAYLDQVDQFDAALFRIAPREAASMDPQQRILLETAWRALEAAGQAPDRQMGRACGVFMGLCNYDYAQIASGGGRIDAWSGTGGAPSIVAGRVSYFFGFEGPAMVVDTACSSSLVSVHLAARSLLDGDCEMALAGGVNLILAPSTTGALSELGMMAPDGRCKAFDASGDGFVRGEGCGVVVLKRLADAQAAGDPVLAVIRGSHINQDGRSSSLTAPNGGSQERVLRAALERAHLTPDTVDHVETHGTGTALGDPIEIHALKSVFGKDRSTPLTVGAVKSNIGHLEAAAGIAGLIKTVLAMRHGMIPPNLHFKTLNPHIELGGFPVRFPDAPTPWPERDGTRIAGVSSFGFSGTNAHVILQQAPERRVSDATPVSRQHVSRQHHLIVASGATPQALRTVADQVAGALSGADSTRLADVSRTSLVGRAQLAHRVAVMGSDGAEMAAALRAAVERAAPVTAPKIGFVFTGQGAQVPGMARALYDGEPVFREMVDRIAHAMDGLLDRPLIEILFDDQTDDIHQTANAQPALFAVGVGLADLFRSWGVEPSALIGHSVGEFAAAVVAGAVSVEDASRLIATRGRLMQALPTGGAMVAVQAGFERVEAARAPDAGLVSIAAINADDATVISGDAEAVGRVAARLEKDGVVATALTVSHAFHSALMDPMLAEFEREAGRCAWREPRLPVFSNLTGQPVGHYDAGYWRAHVRGTVRFADGLAAMVAQGCTLFVELGPKPSLSGLCRRSHPQLTWIETLRPGVPDRLAILTTLGRAFEGGVDIDGHAVTSGFGGRIVELPGYPFDRHRHWVSSPRRDIPRSKPGAHPLLGAARRGPRGGADRREYEVELSVDALPWLADHVVRGVPTLPGAASLEMLAAATGVSGTGAVALKDIVFGGLLPLDAPQLVLTERDGAVLTVSSAAVDGDEWATVATAEIDNSGEQIPDDLDLNHLKARCSRPVDVGAFGARFESQGLHYGPMFRPIREIHAGDVGAGEALVRLVLPDGLDRNGLRLHPALLDGAFQGIGAAAEGLEAATTGYLPAGIGRMVWSGNDAADELWSWCRLSAGEGGALIADLRLFDAEERNIVTVEDLRLLPVSQRAPAIDRPAVIHDILWTKAIPSGQAWDVAETVVWTSPADGGAAEICQALVEVAVDLAGRRDARRLRVVSETANPALGGLVATLRLEYPELDPVLIETDGSVPLERAFSSAGSHLRVVAGEVLARSVTPRPDPGPPSSFALERPSTGKLSELRFQPTGKAEPGLGQVRIAVTATGLNFRDVMNALGTYPGDGGNLGGECAGFVDALGPEYPGEVRVGDRVMAVAPGCHASHVIADAPLVLPIPEGWTDEQAATLPTVFLTAAWALREDGGLHAGHRVLIHAGTGGLGLAAIQIAQAAGAEVLATAGSDEKRAYLRDLGIQCVSDSRSLAFVDDVRTHTGGEGVDIVLNALSGELIAGGFDVLKHGGRFLEVGKAGIWTEDQARETRPDVAYHKVALDETIVRDPARVGAFWRALMPEFADGSLNPLPVTPFAMREAEAAYRFMQQARHIGRIALTRRGMRSDGAYLVTGGTGGLGPEIARWLLARGAGEVVLLSRSGGAVPDDLARMGRVRVEKADVTDTVRVSEIISNLGPSLAGLVHAAGVLDDGVVGRMTAERFAAVMAPKLDGARILDAATDGVDLDMFVLFSSAAGVLGSAGQANYAAANTAMDAIAEARRGAGRQALSVAWGAWQGEGMAAGREGAALSPDQAFAALDALLLEDAGRAVVLAAAVGAAANAPMPDAPSVGPDLRALLAGVRQEDRAAITREAVRAQAAQILSLPIGMIEPHRALNDYGLDSLMAVELRNSLAAFSGEALPASLVFDYPNVAALSDYLLEILDEAGPVVPAVGPPSDPGEVSAQEVGDEMTEEELARALMEEVDRAGF